MIEFWFEFASTYSYPAALRIEKCAAETGHEIVWRPFLLGPIFREQGWDNSPFNIYAAKGNYMWRDLERICQAESLPFRRPTIFPQNGLLAARVACTDGNGGWLPDFVRAVYSANFADDRDISLPATVATCLTGHVADPEVVMQAASGGGAKARLRANTERAVELGIFGAPSFIVDGELFWGNDRLETALAWKQGD